MPRVFGSLVGLLVAGAALPLSARTFGLESLSEAATEPDLCPEPPPAVLANPDLSADGVTLERLGGSKTNKSAQYVLWLTRVTIDAGKKIAQNRSQTSDEARPYGQSIILSVACGSVAITRSAAELNLVPGTMKVTPAATGIDQPVAIGEPATLAVGDSALLESAGYEIAAVDGRAVILLAVFGEQELPCAPCPKYPA